MTTVVFRFTSAEILRASKLTRPRRRPSANTTIVYDEPVEIPKSIRSPSSLQVQQSVEKRQSKIPKSKRLRTAALHANANLIYNASAELVNKI